MPLFVHRWRIALDHQRSVSATISSSNNRAVSFHYDPLRDAFSASVSFDHAIIGHVIRGMARHDIDSMKGNHFPYISSRRHLAKDYVGLPFRYVSQPLHMSFFPSSMPLFYNCKNASCRRCRLLFLSHECTLRCGLIPPCRDAILAE